MLKKSARKEFQTFVFNRAGKSNKSVYSGFTGILVGLQMQCILQCNLLTENTRLFSSYIYSTNFLSKVGDRLDLVKRHLLSFVPIHLPPSLPEKRKPSLKSLLRLDTSVKRVPWNRLH